MSPLSWLITVASAGDTQPVGFVRREGVALDGRAVGRALERACPGARVVGLGEPTHGQHEAFEERRRLTMGLIEGGFRIVAYEASASGVAEASAYVAGTRDDVGAAVEALGMLVWQVEENATLLRELRSWNTAHGPEDQVRFVGVDVQDPGAAVDALAALAPELEARAREVADGLAPAVAKLWSGQIDDWVALAAAAETLVADAAAVGPEAGARAIELRWAVEMFRTTGGRDQAMAELLLAQVSGGARAVFWAHDAHVSRGPLRGQGSTDLAAGGHLAAALGDGYCAVGALFGDGEFHANARTASGAWGFRPYAVGPPPAGFAEAPFVAAGRGDRLLGLRDAPTAGPVAEWLDAALPLRNFGGYGLPEDLEAAADDPERSAHTVLRSDWDAVVFLAHTTAATPIDPAHRAGW